MKYVDCTPTWREILPLLLEIAMNADTLHARNIARGELERMAEIADRAVALEKAKRLSLDEMFAESES
jgi:hypothetical protein